MKAIVHAEKSVERYGGDVHDYLPIHNLIDDSKSTMSDQRHRVLTHNSWFLFILEKIFGSYVENSEGEKVSVRQIGEDHILEDFDNKFIPSAQDWLVNIEFQDWMENGKSGYPDSYNNILKAAKKSKKKKEKKDSKKLQKLLRGSFNDLVVDGSKIDSYEPYTFERFDSPPKQDFKKHTID